MMRLQDIFTPIGTCVACESRDVPVMLPLMQCHLCMGTPGVSVAYPTVPPELINPMEWKRLTASATRLLHQVGTAKTPTRRLMVNTGRRIMPMRTVRTMAPGQRPNVKAVVEVSTPRPEGSPSEHWKVAVEVDVAYIWSSIR